MAAKIAKKTKKAFDRLTLLAGSHRFREDGMCVMEAAAFLAGELHTDWPASVCPCLKVIARSWGDALPSDAIRTRLLKPLVPLSLGTNNAKAKHPRIYLALDWALRSWLPDWCKAMTGDRYKSVWLQLAISAPITDRVSLQDAWPILDEMEFALRIDRRRKSPQLLNSVGEHAAASGGPSFFGAGLLLGGNHVWRRLAKRFTRLVADLSLHNVDPWGLRKEVRKLQEAASQQFSELCATGRS